VKGTYDRRADAAYLYLSDGIRDGEVAKTVPVDPAAIGGMINLDFDEGGRLLGIEVIGASRRLPRELLDRLTPLSAKRSQGSDE